SPLQVCGDLLRRFLEIPFLPRAHGRDLEADCPYYCRQKMSRAADRRPRARPRAWLLLRAAESFYLTEVANFLSIFFNGRPPCRLWPRPPPPLASLFGFRSRTSTCGLSFFSSLIVPFFSLLVVFLVLGCVSRAEIFAPAYDLLVWDQVVQTDQLIFRTLLP